MRSLSDPVLPRVIVQVRTAAATPDVYDDGEDDEPVRSTPWRF